MKKYIIRAVAFALLFCLCFGAAQSVLHYRWGMDNDALYTRNILYSQIPAGTIDVLAIGTSELYDGFSPIVAYEEEGFTGYNFAMTFRSALTEYYQLQYILEYQTPSVLLCDFRSLYEDMLPSDAEPVHRKVVACMPDKILKEQLIREICQVDKSQSYLTWKIPLFRYHSMWSQLTDVEFSRDDRLLPGYSSYRKGDGMVADGEGVGIVGIGESDRQLKAITPELWDCRGSCGDARPRLCRTFRLLLGVYQVVPGLPEDSITELLHLRADATDGSEYGGSLLRRYPPEPGRCCRCHKNLGSGLEGNCKPARPPGRPGLSGRLADSTGTVPGKIPESVTVFSQQGS